MKLLTVEIEDQNVQENFKRIEQAFEAQKILKGSWEFFEFNLNVAVTNKPFVHGFKFTPKDVIQLFKSGAGDVSYTFDRDYVYVTSTGPAVVRVFIGLYNERSQS